jgi:hypothetical protein
MTSLRFYIEPLQSCFISGISMTQILKGRFDGSKAAHRNQSAAPESFPERWTVDPQGQHILTGLSAAETKEFQALDALSPSDGEEVGWTFGGEPTTRREKRWLELYTRHNEAWRVQTNGTSSTPLRPRLNLTQLRDAPPAKRSTP